MKACIGCQVPQSPESFFRDKRAKDGRGSRCRRCEKARMAQYWLDNREKISTANKRWYQENREQVLAAYRERGRSDPNYRQRRKEYSRRRQIEQYGITGDEYAAMLLRQGGCAICGETRHRKQMHIDHDHSTGQVRGILCFKCNVGLGNFGDSAENLRAALAYLEG